MLDSFFALHPRCRNSPRMYREKHAAVIHAVQRPIATVAFRRSGRARKRLCRSGRCNPGCSTRAGRFAARRARDQRLAVGPTTPLVLRGAAPTVAGAGDVARPRRYRDASRRLYCHRPRPCELQALRHADASAGSRDCKARRDASRYRRRPAATSPAPSPPSAQHPAAPAGVVGPTARR